MSEIVEDGNALYNAAQKMGLEGIMAKEKDAKYKAGQRSSAWKKIKFRQEITLSVIGFTKGKGDRSNVFGALHLAEKEGNGWKYYGKVGTGFDMDKLKEIQELLNRVPVTAKPIQEQIEEESRTTWIEPEYLCEVTYASLSSNGTLREPVFVNLVKSD